MPRSASIWIARLAIPAVVLVGVALTWSWWRRHETSQAPHTARVQNARSASERIPIGPTAGSSAVVTQPQTEAADLKREAVAVAGQVAEAYPNDALAYALLGAAYYNIGRSDEATKHLKRCLELRPDQVEAYEILAQVAYQKGELEETARLCREALKRGPATPGVLNRLGRALLDLGQTEEAIRTLQQAVHLSKPISESSYLLGQAYLQSGEYAQAKESFQRAIALLPDHTQAFFGLYTACMRLGQTAEAGRYREQFQKLEAMDRTELTDQSSREDTLTGLPMVRETLARTFFGAAQIYRVHEQAGKAAELFRKSAALDADNPVYRSALEAFYVSRKNLAEGVRVFEQLAAEQPKNSLNYMFLGRLQSRLEHFEAAERSFQKVQELAPQSAEGYRALAELYLRTNRKIDQAPRLARRVLELEPSSAHYYFLAVACLKSKDRAGASEAIKQAVALSPGETKYQEFLQQLKEAP